MRKKLLLFMMLIGSMALHAEDYTYLTFETTDGAKVSVSVSSLSITISGTALTAGDQSFTLSNLSKMYFSSSNETTGIESFTIADWDEITEIYDLKGSKVSKDQMHKGVYVVKSKNGTHKITVR
ncbi:MAG: hypothetical protein IJ185_05665 [Prevotella sp.]|nr:hypothetical protein [Prevotella sp.]